MCPPLADTITPLLSANVVYLIVLNAGIGVLEGKLLKRWFNGKPRAVRLMIAANYLSAWVGYSALIWLLNPHIEHWLAPRPIERINRIALLLLGISFVITLLIEWIPVYFAIQPSRRSTFRCVVATIGVNAVSYVLICIWFMWTSYSLPMNAHVVPLSQFGEMQAGQLYYIDPTGQVIVREIDSQKPEQKLGQIMLNDFVKPWHLEFERQADSARISLIVRYSNVTYRDRPTPLGLVEPADPLLIADLLPVLPDDYWTQSQFMRKSALDLRPVSQRQRVAVDFDWYRHYLKTEVNSGPSSYLTIGLGASEWELSQPTILPDDKIVFEWDGQILLFDPRTRNLAFIANGTCPAFAPGL